MATTRDRYILDVDTKSATRAIDQLKRSIDQLGGSAAQQKVRQLQQTLNSINTRNATRQLDELKRKLSELSRTNADDTIKRIGTSAQSSSGGLKALAAAATAAVAAFAVNKIIDITARYEDLQSTLNSLAGSTNEGAKAFQFIKDFAAQTQFGIEDLTQTYIRLQTAGIAPTARLLRIFSDTAAMTTDQLGALEAITSLVTRSTGGGLGIEELETLANRGIPVYKIFREELGLGRDEIAKFGSTAEGAAKLVDVLLTRLESDFGGATAARLTNLSTVMSNFGDAINNTIAAFGNGMSPAIKEVVGDMTTFLNQNQELAKALGEISGELLRSLADSLKSIAESMGLIDAQGLKLAFADMIIGLGNFITGFQNGIDTLLRGLARVANAMAEIQAKVSGQAIIPAYTPDVDAYLQSLKNERDAFQKIKDELGIISSSRYAEAMRFLFGEGMIGGDIAISDKIKQLNEDIAAIEAGNYFVKIEEDMSGANEEAGRLGERIRGIGEDLKLSAQFPLYEDAILRGVKAQERLAAAAKETQGIVQGTGAGAGAVAPTFDPGPAAQYYNKLIQDSQSAIGAIDNAQQSIIGLNEALSKGVISPETYAEAMRRVNEQLDVNPIQTYQTILDEFNASFIETQATTAMNADAMAQLTEQYSTGAILLEQYRAGVDALGGSFEEYLLAIGDTDAYLRNLQTTVEASLAADARKIDAIRQLTAEFEAGRVAPEIYAQMMQALGADIEFTSGQVRQLQTDFNALTGTAEASLSAMEQRVRAAQEQAELSGYEGVERALRSITLEEERLRDATIERLRTQALASGVSESVLNEEIARIQEQTAATIAARQAAAQTEDDNRAAAERARESARPVSPTARRTTPSQPKSWMDEWFGGSSANAGGGTNFGPDGSKSNPLYVIPVFGAIEDIIGSISKSIINASDLTGNITGTLQSLSAPLARANSGSLMGSLFGGYFATGGNIPPGRFGVVGESGAELVQGPANVSPLESQSVTYNISAVDVRSFQDLLARDPGFVHAVVQRAQRRVPGGR